jgi:hypothetical protein
VSNDNEARIIAVANGGRIVGQWTAWDTACLTQFAMGHPNHKINERLNIEYLTGSVYDEKFGGGRGNPANYRDVGVGTNVTLDDIQLP